MAKKKPIVEQKSILEGIWQDISIYLYLWKNPNSTLKKIGQALDLKYGTIHRLVKVRVKQGFILKTHVRPIVMGEEKLTFSLADMTVEFLKKMQKVFNSKDIQF